MIYAGNEAVSTAPVALCLVPSGPCSVTLTNAGTTTAYVGFGTATTSSNGFPIPSGGVIPAFPQYPGAGDHQLYVVTESGSASVGFLITTPGRYPT